MTNYFSQINAYLAEPLNTSVARHVIVLAGSRDWQYDAVKQIAKGHESNTLWVGESESAEDKRVGDIPACTAKHARHWLGTEKQLVIFNARQKLDVDAFAAISGIVPGGGFFILLMPVQELWQKQHGTYFGQRFLAKLNKSNEITIISEFSVGHDFVANPEQVQGSGFSAPFLSLDQQQAVEKIEQQVLQQTPLPVVLVSDRGRGKSTALGLSAARLLQQGIKHIVITAPRMKAAEIVFRHIAEQLPTADVQRGRVDYEGGFIEFISPDNLVKEEINADVLLVDEAAAIPVSILASFPKKYRHCIYATTEHGYEGTGRGFTVRFTRHLNEKYPGWLKLSLQTPLRWPPGDFLEKWIFDLLCLDAEVATSQVIGVIKEEDIATALLSKQQIFSDPVLLKELFSLLVLAHYRTRPADLVKLLDDEAISVYVSTYHQHVVAVALIIREGGLAPELSTAVYRGERRPPGNLLAQSLTYHCGIEHAATLKYARVMRIAVHPAYQKQKIGSRLLEFVAANEMKNGHDAIGTSFGMTAGLLDFWQQANYVAIRVGLTREQSSGEHAVMMLLPLSENGSKIKKEAVTRFNGQMQFLVTDVLKDLPGEILGKLIISSECVLKEYQKKDLYSFIRYSRNYELCIAAINNFIEINQKKLNDKNFPSALRQIILLKTREKLDWKQVSRKMELAGQAEARKLFHKAIVELHGG